jgi:hypothetical protein
MAIAWPEIGRDIDPILECREFAMMAVKSHAGFWLVTGNVEEAGFTSRSWKATAEALSNLDGFGKVMLKTLSPEARRRADDAGQEIIGEPLNEEESGLGEVHTFLGINAASEVLNENGKTLETAVD